MQGDEQVVELLNEVLTAEFTAVNQYLLDAKMFDNRGYAHLGERYRAESIGEMKDAERLIERILYLEREATTRLNRGIAFSVERADNGSRDLFEDILGGEEGHAGSLETQLALISQIGEVHYLAQQIGG
jgi:bacterioferritin